MTKKENHELHPITTLLVSRLEAAGKIQSQIEKGREIGNLLLHSYEDLEKANTAHQKWSKYNRELLSRLFSTKEFVNEYSWSQAGVISTDPDFIDEVKYLKSGLRQESQCLESILERLELIPDTAVTQAHAASVNAEPYSDKNVFVVHGHDDAAKQLTARFLEKLGLKPIILHEQANAGKTIIEKFEYHSDVGYAVVLLTPDDVGATRNSPDVQNPRARQNVIFELGYFVGKLGRSRVCALYKEGVEIPSDFLGVLYVPMDTSGAWQLYLAKEMKQAGIEVDLNRAI